MKKNARIVLLAFGVFGFCVAIFYYGNAELFQGRLNIKPAYNENRCLDSDGGKNYEQAGSIHGKISRTKSGNRTDICNTGVYLNEYYCDGVFIKNEEHICENGCVNGACDKGTPFEELISNPKVKIAIGEITSDEMVFLKKSYSQLISQDTISWKEFDDRWEFSYEEIRRIWLRRMAFSLFAELNHNLTWSIKDYNQNDLNTLLSFEAIKSTEYEGQGFPVFSYDGKTTYYLSLAALDPNPQSTYEISLKLFDKLKKVNFSTRKDLIDNIILGMREMGWSHGISGDTGLINPTSNNIEFLYENPHNGSCHTNDAFIAAIARVWNIPTLIRHNSSDQGHSQIIFLTESLGLHHGDDIAGFFAQYLSIEDFYLKQSDLDNWRLLKACDGYPLANNQKINIFLSHYKDSKYNSGIYFGPKGYCNKQEEYLIELLNGMLKECSAEDKIFSDAEIKSWTKELEKESVNICVYKPEILGAGDVLKPNTKLEIMASDLGEKIVVQLACEPDDPKAVLSWYNIFVLDNAPYEFLFDTSLCGNDDCSKKVKYSPSCQKIYLNLEIYAKNGKYMNSFKYGPYPYLAE